MVKDRADGSPQLNLRVPMEHHDRVRRVVALLRTVEGFPGRLDELWFGERSASILVATDAATTSRVLDRAQAAGVPAAVIGTVEGQQITFGPGFSIELGDARLRYETALLAAAAQGAVHG